LDFRWRQQWEKPQLNLKENNLRTRQWCGILNRSALRIPHFDVRQIIMRILTTLLLLFVLNFSSAEIGDYHEEVLKNSRKICLFDTYLDEDRIVFTYSRTLYPNNEIEKDWKVGQLLEKDPRKQPVLDPESDYGDQLVVCFDYDPSIGRSKYSYVVSNGIVRGFQISLEDLENIIKERESNKTLERNAE